MHFWQPAWKLCCHKSKRFMFQVRIKKNLQNFQKIIYILKMILWRHRVHFSILLFLPEKFSPRTVNVRSKFWRVWKKNQNFQKLFFYSKRSFGHVDCSFNKQVENFPAKFQKKFLFILFHFSCQHLRENSNRHLECNFDNPGEISVSTNPKNFCSKSE